MVSGGHSFNSVLITGASSGVGAALALAYAGANIRLVLFGRDAKRLDDVAAQCNAKGANVATYLIDVRDRAAMQLAVEEADDAKPIDLVIANAGVSGGTLGLGESDEQARTIFDVNVNGVLNTIHPIIPRMQKREGGAIALMSSLAAYHPLPGAPAYSASKAAVLFYAEALHGALKQHGVFVSAVCPGFIDTALTKVNGFKMPALMEANEAARRIICGLEKRNPHISFPKRLAWPLRFLQFLPVFLRRFFFGKLPEKPSQ